MRGQHLSRILRLAGGALALVTAAGCFQPAGSGFEQPNFASQPTFTLPATEVIILPTDTPPLDPSATVADLAIQFDTPTPVQIAVVPTDTASPSPSPQPLVSATPTPIDNSAAINALLTPAGAEVAQVVTPALDPFSITATFIVGQATAQAGLPLTQTAQAIFGAQPTATLNPLFPTAAPGAFFTATPGLSVTVAPGADCIHEVQSTDPNLYRISLAYGTTVDAIARASGITNVSLIYVGQQLTIPGCGTTGVRPPATSTPGGTGQTVPGTGTGTGGGAVHIVAQGETLFELSLQYGVPVASIASANGIANINLIYIGQELVIP